MKKLVVIFLGLLFIFGVFMKKDSTSLEKSLETIDLKNEKELLPQERHIDADSSSFSPLPHLLQKKIIQHQNNKDSKDSDAPYVAYLEYRKEQNIAEQQRLNRYLTHQKNLQQSREGGIRLALEKEHKKHELRFQKQYKSKMMSQRKQHQEHFIQHNKQMKQKREQMHSLRSRQILHTKYRGEL